jgi:hypothetical protein
MYNIYILICDKEATPQWNLSDEARIVTASMFKTLAFAAETFLFAYIGLCFVTFEYVNAVPLALVCSTSTSI